MTDPKRPLYVSTGRHVAALDPATGGELWRTRLPTSGMSVVSLILSDGRLFAGHAGNVYCLDPRTGNILWNNGLPSMGFQPVILVREGSPASQDAVVAAQVLAAAAASSDASAAAVSVS